MCSLDSAQCSLFGYTLITSDGNHMYVRTYVCTYVLYIRMYVCVPLVSTTTFVPFKVPCLLVCGLHPKFLLSSKKT